jgi:hypothetical protein
MNPPPGVLEGVGGEQISKYRRRIDIDAQYGRERECAPKKETAEHWSNTVWNRECRKKKIPIARAAKVAVHRM